MWKHSQMEILVGGIAITLMIAAGLAFLLIFWMCGLLLWTVLFLGVSYCVGYAVNELNDWYEDRKAEKDKKDTKKQET